MYLVTLDLATRIGWTAGAHDDPAFKFGSHQLPSTGEDVGSYACAFEAWLSDFFPNDRMQGAMVCFEQPVLSKKTMLLTLRKLYGLAYHVEMHFSGVCQVVEANNVSVKKFFTGDGWADKGDMMAMCQRRGFAVTDHDQADAIGARVWTVHQQFPEVARIFDGGLGSLGVGHGEAVQKRGKARA